ncbi:SDR family NAD(P)-dependent oxidoreductase [Bacteroides ihuae]|uniref:SDR family NAD(P)-dependent oxidoreductase n=1 Tax=Bacteroides ihuae TaxID=1852362 RepID=UPI0008DA97F6|nr:SDR family NAD(P)-dependent oxidoreductase [Bacteroides ihuae]
MKKAIIIGATSGIGKELAIILAENGYLVGITGRRNELLEDLKKKRTGAFITSSFDIADIKTAIEKLNELTIQLNGLDLLIISSGTGDINEELNFEIEKRTIDINVSGFTNIADWGFNYFQKQKSGHLVAISSLAGLRGSRHAPSYNATKSYQINYLEGLRQKSASLRLPIFVTDIRPGFVDTNMAKGEGLFWVSTVEKAAKQIFTAIKKRKNVAYITKRWRFIAIIIKQIPGFIYNRM